MRKIQKTGNSLSLPELIDLEELQAIQDSIAKTVGISSAISSPDDVPLTRFSYPTGFCSLIQSTEEGKRRCLLSFKEMSERAPALKKSTIMYCFAHCAHFVAPIIINGEHTGAMFAGQFIPQRFSEEQLTEIRRIAEEINIDPELLVKEATRMRVVEEEKVRNYSSLLFQIVGVIARLGAQSAELNRAKNKLQKAHDELEMRVEERTAELAKTTEYLRREKERAEEYLNIAGVVLAMLDADEKISLINKKGCEILGYKEEELIGRNWFDILVPQRIRGEIRGIFGKQMAGDIEPVEYYENTLLTKEGEERLIVFHNTVIRDKNSQTVGVLFSGEDITERKQAEDEVKESRVFLAAVIENIPDPIYIKDRKFRFAEVNKAFLHRHKVAKEEIIGKTRFRETDAEIFKTGRKLDIPEQHYHDAEGNQHWTYIKKVPLTDESGEITHVLTISRDITERKQAEEALRKSEGLFRAIFETAQDSIFIKDRTLNYIQVNPAMEKLFGQPASKLIELTDDDLFGEEAGAHISEVDSRVLGGEIIKEEHTKPVKGIPHTFHVIKVPICDSSGEIIGLCGIARDITERKRAEEQIKASLREKEVLLKEIHHRVKNNMQVIISLLNLQSKHVKDKHDLEIFKDSQNRIKSMALIHDKLYQSKDLASIDFAEYIENLASHLFNTYSVSSSAIKFVADIKDVPLDINTAIPCGLIINELISNSLKYAFPDGQEGEILIKLYASKEDTSTLIVSDKGIGLPEDLDFRNTESLGLQVVVALVEQLKGTIELDRSEGTAFKIVFKKSK
jgi:PAS domain S-box-containing protein